MPNMALQKNPMPALEPLARRGCFDEVALGYSEAQARGEAARCLNCRHKPCVSGCPVQVDIPGFVREIAEGDPEKAFAILSEATALPAVCGRVCPQETQCEKRCVRAIKGEPVAIGYLERWCADTAREAALNKNADQPHRREADNRTAGTAIAVVGAGPASLACAGELAKRGCAVTIFEAFHAPGGVLIYGIPEFRLPKRVVAYETARLEALGVKIVTNVVVGKTVTVEELRAQFQAVFLGTGAGLPNFMGVPGENRTGVYSANEYLTRINLMHAYDAAYDTPPVQSEKVAVVGGGNVAMDAARCAVRLGAREVSVVYRRSEAEMPARAEEIAHAREEGVRFVLLAAPTAVLGDETGRARALACVKMELCAPGADGRRAVKEQPGSAFEVEADTVIVAIGSRPNRLVREGAPGLAVNRRGGLVVREDSLETMLPGVYAGGDAVTGAETVILAMGAGKAAAEQILRSLQEN